MKNALCWEQTLKAAISIEVEKIVCEEADAAAKRVADRVRARAAEIAATFGGEPARPAADGGPADHHGEISAGDAVTAGELCDELSRRLACGSLNRDAEVRLSLLVADCAFDDMVEVGAEFEECSERTEFRLSTNIYDITAGSLM